MKKTKVALRYAKAVLNLAVENNSETEVNSNMKTIASTIKENDELQTMLKSPIVKSTEKLAVLNGLFGNKANNVTKGLFNLLQENKRIMLLEDIALKYNTIYDAYQNTQVAKVITAVPITKELKEKVKEKIITLTGNKATIENIINPKILGGFILQVGDKQFDASISSKFKNLRKEFNNNQYQTRV